MARLSACFLSLALVVCATNGLNLPSEDATHRLLQHEALEAKLNHVEAQLEARMEAQQQTSNAQISGLKAEVVSLRTGQPVSLATDRQCCSLGRMPASCEDLGKIGHLLAGFYTVKSVAGLQSIYCDFTKTIKDTGFQKTIGLNSVKTTPVYFFAQRDTPTSDVIEQTVTFGFAPVNIGGALDIKSGILTAPVTGKYFISFAGQAISGADGNGKSWANILKGTTRYASGYCLGQPSSDTTCPLHVHATIDLNKGDKVSVQLQFQNGAFLHDDTSRYTQYTGYLIDENVSSLLA